jgi:hypothetical protein
MGRSRSSSRRRRAVLACCRGRNSAWQAFLNCCLLSRPGGSHSAALEPVAN